MDDLFDRLSGGRELMAFEAEAVRRRQLTGWRPSMMSIVVDLGCFPHPMPAGGVETSIPQLVERFHPDVLYGFDPWPEQADDDYLIGTTRVIVRRHAAWTSTDVIDYDPRELGSTVMREKNLHGEWRSPYPMRIPTFDFPAWLQTMMGVHPGHQWVVKMDIEGAEFPLLSALYEHGTDARIDLLLVEWHDNVMEREFRDQRAALEHVLRCPVEPW